MSNFDSVFWAFIEALTWICMRDRASVELAMESSNLLRLELTRALEINIAEGNAVDCKAALPNVETAKVAILNELTAGRLIGYAIRESGSHEEVPTLHWLDLKFSEISNGECHAISKSSNTVRWRKLRFRSEQVQILWPDPLAALVAKPVIATDELAQAPDEPQSENSTPVPANRDIPTAGRKVGTVKNPSELKVANNLVQRFKTSPELRRLRSQMIAAAADEEGFVMPSEARALDAFEKRMRHHLMNYSDIAPRISKNRQAK